LQGVTSFTDYFVICSVANIRQGQAACDEIELTLKNQGERANSIEGYDTGEWILMDYGDFLVHIFSQTARSYYDLERLWRGAESVEVSVGTSSDSAVPRPSNAAGNLK
jgi:ribosome-associated protein